MPSIKTIFSLFIITSLLILLSACHRSENANVIKVGTIAGPETQLMETAKQVAAKKYGLDIEIVQFTDYVMPNSALENGSIDANMFQTLPYLQTAIKAQNYNIVPIGKIFIYPVAIYSKKITQLNQLKQDDSVAVPNDPSNEARALLLLEDAGLIKLKAGANTSATPEDIINNPKALVIKSLDAAQLPRALPDITIAVINTNYAMLAGLSPSHGALFVEGKDSPYANLVVVRKGEENRPQFKQLMNALHSQEVVQEAQKLFKDGAIAAWQTKSN